MLIQRSRLLSERDANIFEAACKLFQKRQIDTKVCPFTLHNNPLVSNTLQAMKSCRVRLSHPVPAPAAIYCKTCHFSKCYTHLLDLDSVHSVDAMILSDLPDGDANWHQYHRNSSQQYQEVRQRAIEDEEKGSRPNASHRLIYLAKTFSTCRAMALEVTKHGWYDRFVQTISIPVSYYSDPLYCRLHYTQIANSPAKALVGLPDEIGGNDSYDSHASDDSTPASKGGDPQTTASRRTPTPPLVTSSTSSGGINEIEHLPHSGLSIIPYPRSPIVDPMSPSSKSGRLEVLGSATDASIRTQHDTPSPLSAPCSPLSARQPSTAMSLSHAVLDDPENLSDLTDLPTEVDSPPRSSIIALPGSEIYTRPVTGSKSKSRVVLDFVEISRPEWYSGKRDKIPSSSRQKRKRIAGPFSPDIAGPSDSDTSPSAAQEISNRSLSKRKKKMSKGPASR